MNQSNNEISPLEQIINEVEVLIKYDLMKKDLRQYIKLDGYTLSIKFNIDADFPISDVVKSIVEKGLQLK